MKNGLFPKHCWVLSVALIMSVGVVSAEMDLERIAELHWHPTTAQEARSMTVAAATWLADADREAESWYSSVQVRTLALSQRGERVPGEWASLGDGVFGWLVQARDHNLAGPGEPFPQPELKWLEFHEAEPQGSGRIGRLEWVAAIKAPEVWGRLERRLSQVDTEDQSPSLADLWAALAERIEADAPAVPGLSEFVRTQAGHTLAFAAAVDPVERRVLVDRILRTQAEYDWEHGNKLSAVWKAFEALARLAAVDSAPSEARPWLDWFEGIEAEQVRGLRQIDTDLPVIIALLEDAAGYLSSAEPSAVRAMSELADVYARLALFVPDMSFYLDQPVRSEIRTLVAACNPDPLLVGPMPRDIYERCIRNLFDLIEGGLDSEELAGGRQGPFAPEFLRRELGLVSWQRAGYLDGHLGWMLDAPCEPPEWVNVLEWSLMVEHLVRWVPQRPVFFAGPRWQEVLDAVREQAIERADSHQDWMDCLSGHGGERRDPVQRLLDRHENALRELAVLLNEADEQFYAEVVRPGADIDLDGSASQVSGYRPEGLVVRPCPQSDSCGARLELPVSRALLGLFPNAYLLADQLGMGEIGLCYDAVRWIDRQARPARQRDARVANYDGRLSFELFGTFREQTAEEPETVFHYRLAAAEPRHYLFAAADPELLELECPREIIGASVASTLPDDRLPLIPDRLTYFVSAPTTAEAELAGNWDRGAEWRDWFVTGDRVERIEAVDGAALEVAVQARLTALSARRERQLAAQLTAPVRVGETSPIAQAMARVADSVAMFRRLLEIHYPRVIRHHTPVRAMLAGEAGLISRDRVRMLREEGVPMLLVPRIGLERTGELRDQWMQLPVALREQGQLAPETDYGFERLDQLMQVSRDEPAVFELPEEP